MSTQPPLDSKLSLKPLDHSSLPSHDSFDAIFRDAQAVIDEAASWPAGKTYSDGLVQTATRKARNGEPLDWHTRLSKHADRSYDDMKRGLLLDHAKNESQYVPDLHTVERIEVIKPNEAEIWHNLYHQPFPASNRDFCLLILTREAADQQSFLVISIPYIHPDAPSPKGYERAAYASVEQARIVGNEVEWRMVVTSDAGGKVPSSITESVMPSQIAQDVPHYLEWLDGKVHSSTVKDKS